MTRSGPLPGSTFYREPLGLPPTRARQKAEILNFRFKERVAVYAKRVDEAHAQVAAKTLMLERKDLLLERVMKKFKLSDAEAKRLEAGLQPETVAAKQQESIVSGRQVLFWRSDRLVVGLLHCWSGVGPSVSLFCPFGFCGPS